MNIRQNLECEINITSNLVQRDENERVRLKVDDLHGMYKVRVEEDGRWGQV